MIIAVIIFSYLILGTVTMAYADHKDKNYMKRDLDRDSMIFFLWPFFLVYVITKYLLEENKKIKNKR